MSDRAYAEDLYYWSQMGSHEKWTAALVSEMAQALGANEADIKIVRRDLHT